MLFHIFIITFATNLTFYTNYEKNVLDLGFSSIVFMGLRRQQRCRGHGDNRHNQAPGPTRYKAP